MVNKMLDYKDIKDTIVLSDLSLPIEVEVKFGEYNNNFAGLSFSSFLRLSHHLKDIPHHQELLTLYYNNNVKKSITYNEEEMIRWSSKKTLNYLNNTNYPIFTFVNQEQ